MLTTIDNPFNPSLQYDEWWRWDHDAGYHTPGLLARWLVSSDELSEEDQDFAMEQAITEICKEDLLGVYRKFPIESTRDDKTFQTVEETL